MRFPGKWLRNSLSICGCGLLLLAFTSTARAELGGDQTTIRVDGQRLRGAVQVRQAQSYAVHEIRTESTGVVREYVSREGKVFGVAYDGPIIGESNRVLGSYSAQIAQAVKAKRGERHIGGPVVVRVGDLVYEASGHLRSYHVRAYVDSSVPQGVAKGDIR